MALQCSPLASRLLAKLVLIAAGSLSVPAVAQSSYDVVGVRPGMTEAEAMAVLESHRSGMMVNKRNMSYTYRDGVQQHNTPEFLYEIHAVSNDIKEPEDFRLYFAPLPSESRLVGVVRQVKLPAPPTQAQLIEQLSQKYGEPVVSSKSYSSLTLAWGEPDKPMCWRSNPKATAIGTGDGSGIVGNLTHGQTKGWAPKDLSQCGVAVSATLSGEPVNNLRVVVTDYGAWASTQIKANEWVEGLEKEAVNARLSKGAAPKL